MKMQDKKIKLGLRQDFVFILFLNSSSRNIVHIKRKCSFPLK